MTNKERYELHNRRVTAAKAVKGTTKIKVLANAAKIYRGIKLDGV